MKIHLVEQKTPEWLELRKGKITGTGLKKIVGTPTVRGNYFYEILAERLSVGGLDDESALERGNRLESKAIEEFEKKTGKIVSHVGFCVSDFSPFVGFSPDGLIEEKKKYVANVEVKCLSGANHIKAWLDNEVPKEYMPQVIQGLIVNEDAEKTYFVLYDPRVTVAPLVIIEVLRKDVEKEIDAYKEEQMKFLEDVESKLSAIVEI